MATNNAFSKEEIVFFDEVLEGFEPNNITAKQVQKYQPPATAFERGGLTVNRPIPYVSQNKDGLTLVSSDYAAMTQLSVPSTLNANDVAPSHVRNIPFTMNAVELNDPAQRQKKVKSSLLALSALADNVIATKIANEGTLFIKDTAAGGITTYGQVAACEEAGSIRDVPIMGERTLIMNVIDYNDVAGALASTDKVQTGVGATAFQRSRIPQIATFDSFKANFMPRLAAAAGGGGITVNGAQKHIPVATDANGQNVDNRSMNLTVSATTNVVAGDAFTIANVNGLSMQHKNDIGSLQTFRVLEVVSATVLKISPAIVTNAGTPTQAEIEYANCSAAAANGAAIVFLNTVAAPVNIFFENNAVEIIHGSLATVDMDGAGVQTMRETTDSGIEILFAKSSNIDNLGTKYRLVMWMDATILNEQMCGVLVGKQT